MSAHINELVPSLHLHQDHAFPNCYSFPVCTLPLSNEQAVEASCVPEGMGRTQGQESSEKGGNEMIH